MRLLKEETMAIIIDFQEKLVPVMSNKEELISNTEKLIQGLEILQVPAVVTQQYTKGMGMTVEPLQNLYGDTFSYNDKITFSCYEDEAIAAKIKELNKKNIIICGIEAHICVLQTALDCIEAGYNVTIIEDCVSSRKYNDKKIALKRAEKEGAVISTYESVLFELTRMAGNDTFKQISKLIK